MTRELTGTTIPCQPISKEMEAYDALALASVCGVLVVVMIVCLFLYVYVDQEPFGWLPAVLNGVRR